ncbi:MAG TPA: DUF3300 domain-containing protein [Pyrinomonadaceae bacterium]|nr:DUF3300 domain-containing protein [Pyrinomonadaceae bacterium]
MEAGSFRSAFQQGQLRTLTAVLCLALLVQGNSSCGSKTPQSPQSANSPQLAQTPANEQSANASADQQPAIIPASQLDSLVAPIALYPDPLISQVLVASTYPLEIIQLQQWLEKNENLKDKALVNEVSKQPWDPSIQAMAALPEVVKRLADDIQWTTDLGNAFLAQQSDVMDAIQRMREKAQGTGALKSNEQVRVETKVVENKTVIVIEQASPEVVYVPSYDPVYVYGPPVYPYPAIYYPPYPTGAVLAATAISFGVGVAIGAAWGGGWGWGCGWGDNDIDINVNNNFNRNANISGGNRANISGGNKWQHNPRHRGGAPYPNRGTADRFGGTARGDSLANRQRAASKQLDRQGVGSVDRRTASDRSRAGGGGGVGNRGGERSRSAAANRGGSAAGERASSRGGARANDRSSSPGNRGSRSGGDRVGNRSVGSGSENRGAFGDSGYSGSGARASSSRGASSVSGSRGSHGGASRGGFSGGGGGGRSGGGGGRGGGGGGRRR